MMIVNDYFSIVSIYAVFTTSPHYHLLLLLISYTYRYVHLADMLIAIIYIVRKHQTQGNYGSIWVIY